MVCAEFACLSENWQKLALSMSNWINFGYLHGIMERHSHREKRVVCEVLELKMIIRQSLGKTIEYVTRSNIPSKS